MEYGYTPVILLSQQDGGILDGFMSARARRYGQEASRTQSTEDKEQKGNSESKQVKIQVLNIVDTEARGLQREVSNR